MNDAHQLWKTIVERVGPFDIKDRHRPNIVKRNIAVAYVLQRTKMRRCDAAKILAKKLDTTTRNIRMIMQVIYQDIESYLRDYPKCVDILNPDIVAWRKGSVHVIQSAEWYRKYIPKVSDEEEYDVEYDGEGYNYVARKDSRLAERMKLCGRNAVVTDAIVDAYHVRAVRIAQDGGMHLYKLIEFVS